jgi:hypothetical protein
MLACIPGSTHILASSPQPDSVCAALHHCSGRCSDHGSAKNTPSDAFAPPLKTDTSDPANNYEACVNLPAKATNREPRPHAADERLQ